MQVRANRWIKRYMAIFLAAVLVTGSALPACADEEVSVDINAAPTQMSTPDAVDEPVLVQPTPAPATTTPAANVYTPSAALQRANEAVREGNAAVDQAKSEKTEMEDNLQKTEDIKQELVKNRDALNAVVYDLDSEIQSVIVNLNEVEQLLEQKESELAATSAKLMQARQDAEDQYESMKIRIKFMYEKGTTDFVQIILGAGSFSEMLNKAEYIEQLSAYDRNMLIRYEKTKEEMAELEEVLETQQEVLAQTKEDVEGKKSAMETLMNEKASQLSAYNKDIAEKQAAIEEYEEMIKEQDETIGQLEKAAEAARKKQQQAIAAENGGSVSGNYVTYSGGQFCWPAPSYTRISDDYGTRIHPILKVEKFHNGVDMAAPTGSPILAAADGVVIAAAYSSTMGNYIMIDHGSGIYTIYMHASALYVSADQKVKKGDTIGAVGSTGRSTGAHLHFSVRVNGNYVSPWGYL